MPQPDLGQRLRALRTERALPIAEVAGKTGISASFLSLVETGKSDISIGRLSRLTEFYDIGLGDLFPQELEDPIEVMRRDTYPHLPSSSEGIDLLLLAPARERAMTPLVAIYEPGGEMSEPSGSEGDAFIYVLEGELVIRLEPRGEETVLAEGDSAYIRGGTKRSYRNVGTTRAAVLGVVAGSRLASVARDGRALKRAGSQ